MVTTKDYISFLDMQRIFKSNKVVIFSLELWKITATIKKHVIVFITSYILLTYSWSSFLIRESLKVNRKTATKWVEVKTLIQYTKVIKELKLGCTTLLHIYQVMIYVISKGMLIVNSLFPFLFSNIKLLQQQLPTGVLRKRCS